MKLFCWTMPLGPPRVIFGAYVILAWQADLGNGAATPDLLVVTQTLKTHGRA